MPSFSKQGQTRSVKGKGKGNTHAEMTEWIKRVDLWKYVAIRSYPDNRGRPLFADGKAAVTHFTPDYLFSMMDGDNSELRRDCMGVNLGCASIDGASLFLPKIQKLDGDLAATTFGEEDLVEAVRYLNLARTAGRCPDDSKNFAKKLIEHLRTDSARTDDMAKLASMAEAASSVYLGCISAMEMIAFANNVKDAAKKIPDVKKQPKDVQNWIKEPKNIKHLHKAIAKAIEELEKKTKDRVKVFGELDEENSSDDASDENSSCAGNSNSSSSSSASETDAAKKTTKTNNPKNNVNKKTEKEQKQQKDKKEGKEDKDSKRKRKDQDDKRNKQVKKDKKSDKDDKPEKKKAKRHSSSASSASDTDHATTAISKIQRASLRKAWPLKEMQDFETVAAMEMSKAHFQTLEAQTVLDLVEKVPA
jgi:chemotaxis protein histidine kinase CheA